MPSLQLLWSADVREGGGVPGSRSPASPALPGCFSKDQVYLDGILRILRHRQTIDFPLLAALGKVMAEWGKKVPHPGDPISHGLPQSRVSLKTSPRLSARQLFAVPCGFGFRWGRGRAVLDARKDGTIRPPLWEIFQERLNPVG